MPWNRRRSRQSAAERNTLPLTTIDSHAALIIIDLQKGVVAVALAHPAAEIVGRSAELARAFRKRGIPVVLVHVTAAAPGRTDAGPRMTSPPPDWAGLVPELEQQPGDYIVSKQRVGAFIGTSLDAYLRERSVTQVFLTGIATSGGVEATARSAHDLGYNVVLVTDAMTDRDLETHTFQVNRIFPRIGQTTSTAGVLSMMEEHRGSASLVTQ